VSAILYASEILHQAGIHPEVTCQEIQRKGWDRIHAAMRDILQRAIDHEGSTLQDGTYRNAINGEGQYQNQHQVYAKHGEICLRCKRTRIIRIVQSQRSTFFCPRCQRRRH
jgi:formamidopyrimidine-DNA glycosylase